MGPSGSNPCSAAKLAKESHMSSYMQFVEDLLGAAASLETFSEILCLKVQHESLQVHACKWYDFHQKCELVEITGLNGMGEKPRLILTQLY